MKLKNMVSLCPLILLAVVTLVDFDGFTATPETPSISEFDHQRNEGYVAFVVNESAYDRTPRPDDPDPAECACGGTGILTHGDGHQTPCPCRGTDNNPDDGERDWKCECDSEKKGTYCGCKEEHDKCDCDKHGVNSVKKKECPKCKS